MVLVPPGKKKVFTSLSEMKEKEGDEDALAMPRGRRVCVSRSCVSRESPHFAERRDAPVSEVSRNDALSASLTFETFEEDFSHDQRTRAQRWRERDAPSRERERERAFSLKSRARTLFPSRIPTCSSSEAEDEAAERTKNALGVILEGKINSCKPTHIPEACDGTQTESLFERKKSDFFHSRGCGEKDIWGPSL